MIAPGTIAAIAASLLGQAESLKEDSDIFSPAFTKYRQKRISQFVFLALDIAKQTEKHSSNPQ